MRSSSTTQNEAYVDELLLLAVEGCAQQGRLNLEDALVESVLWC